LLLEEDDLSGNDTAVMVDRDLQSLTQQKGFDKVKGIVIGRFQKSSKITRQILNKIVQDKKELKHIPVIANVDFGHTTPMITFPIGGTVKVNTKESCLLEITHH
jgi:muramoyltetrapeptide carboxypeptidase LdcA involved in peptidoglycan recycling